MSDPDTSTLGKEDPIQNLPSWTTIQSWVLRPQAIAKCFISDIYQMSSLILPNTTGTSYGSRDTFLLDHFPCRMVNLVGASTTQLSSCTNETVHFPSAKERKALRRAQTLENTTKMNLSQRPPVKMYEKKDIRVGDVVRVVGKVDEWQRRRNGAGEWVRQVVVEDGGGGSITRVDPDEQFLHVTQVNQLHRTLYSQPFIMPPAPTLSRASSPLRQRKLPSPAKSVRSVMYSDSLAPSSEIGSEVEYDEGPVPLRDPSKLRSSQLTDHTFRHYLLDHMTQTTLSTIRSMSPNQLHLALCDLFPEYAISTKDQTSIYQPTFDSSFPPSFITPRQSTTASNSLFKQPSTYSDDTSTWSVGSDHVGKDLSEVFGDSTKDNISPSATPTQAKYFRSKAERLMEKSFISQAKATPEEHSHSLKSFRPYQPHHHQQTLSLTRPHIESFHLHHSEPFQESKIDVDLFTPFAYPSQSYQHSSIPMQPWNLHQNKSRPHNHHQNNSRPHNLPQNQSQPYDLNQDQSQPHNLYQAQAQRHSHEKQEFSYQEPSLETFTIPSILSIPHLNQLAGLVVDAESKRTERARRKRITEGIASQADLTISPRAYKLSGEKKRRKMERLVRFVLRRISEEGGLVHVQLTRKQKQDQNPTYPSDPSIEIKDKTYLKEYDFQSKYSNHTSPLPYMISGINDKQVRMIMERDKRERDEEKEKEREKEKEKKKEEGEERERKKK
ncbi:hypothetical protein TREMEDRAFT_62034 [Tremella mesenterica DSM 1558]|uniref:uncharacterized protein n=1 Tax=Tremella mesenterica (strain ATCC 24925 / CBS 8224 / DSM 1558 / NBRC 9311 / NRRL Y-6157 / RJB 2259-6 / UBC 559-6) TaxID=578456 RepID=UPI0003F48FFD|nr:uncharacterized protein TREMEDRAFT_62034 [Tremella mesenterica DSM 1558]EIW70273.1 hypothetical protein TREMEDRAFT_62034 [Tremella mesenterica DSM 1558]